MTKYTVEVASDHVCDLGEGPHWDEKNQILHYVDLLAGDVCQLDPVSGETRKVHLGGYTTVVIPIENQQELITSRGNQLLKLNFNTKETKVLLEIEKNVDGNRLNDGKCDPKGRLFIGTMGSETTPGVVSPDKGSLYSVDSLYNIERKAENVSLSNGIEWSPDHKNMYFIDSTKRTIYVFDFDVNTGKVANQRVLVNFNENKDFDEKELPDGMTIDKSGKLWVASYFGGRVIKIDPNNGKIIDEIKLPAKQITSACFGGKNLNEMYVTSASKRLTPQEKTEQPQAGHIFKVTSDDPSFIGIGPGRAFIEKINQN